MINYFMIEILYIIIIERAIKHKWSNKMQRY